MNQDGIAEYVEQYSNRKLELYCVSSSAITMSAMKGELSSFSLARTQGVAARVLCQGRMGFAFTEKADDTDRAVQMAAENARFIAEDAGNALCEVPDRLSSQRYYSRSIDEVAVEAKKAFVLDLEKAAYAFDKRVANVPSAYYGEASSHRMVVNSFGLNKASKANFCYSYLYLMVTDGKDTTVGYWGMGGTRVEALDRDRIVSEAVTQATAQLGAGEVDSGKYPIVLTADMASDLLESFFGPRSPFFAENVQLGLSRLADKEHEPIASEIVNLVDDPASPGIGRREFDGEGVTCRRMVIVERGRLENFLYNLYAAKRAGRESTGHGDRASHKSAVTTAPSNVVLQNGQKTEDQLVAQVRKGIYVTDLEGLHASTDPISGDFSAGAKGRLIEDGCLTRPLRNFTIAGNFFEVLHKVLDLADNRRDDSFNHVTSPSILVDEVDVSGK